LYIVTIHVNQECATCGPQKGPDSKGYCQSSVGGQQVV